MAKDQIPSNAETIRREGRRWPILLVLVIAALLISTGVALGGRWVYREFIEDEPANPAPTQLESSPATQTEKSEAAGGEANAPEPQQNDSETTPLPATGG